MGATKFDPNDQTWIRMFSRIGLGDWLRYATGIVEVFGAICLLIPRIAALGAITLDCTMVGAGITNYHVIGNSAAARVDFVLIVLLLVIAWQRRAGTLQQHRQ